MKYFYNIYSFNIYMEVFQMILVYLTQLWYIFGYDMWSYKKNDENIPQMPLGFWFVSFR